MTPSDSHPPTLSLAQFGTPMPQPHILMIEDERGLTQSLSWYFSKEGYQTHIAENGLEGLEKAKALLPDVVLLDVNLPGLNGFDVCRELRAGETTRDIPIIFLTARSEESDQVVGYSLGADDYVPKPFSNKVLLAKVKALLRRAETSNAPKDVIEHLGVKIDRVAHRATFDDKRLDLTPTEYRLLETLLRKPGQAFSRQQLLELALGQDSIAMDRTIDIYIKTLRQKLNEVGGDEHLIQTVRGVGYQFRERSLTPESPSDGESGTRGEQSAAMSTD